LDYGYGASMRSGFAQLRRVKRLSAEPRDRTRSADVAVAHYGARTTLKLKDSAKRKNTVRLKNKS